MHVFELYLQLRCDVFLRILVLLLRLHLLSQFCVYHFKVLAVLGRLTKLALHVSQRIIQLTDLLHLLLIALLHQWHLCPDQTFAVHHFLLLFPNAVLHPAAKSYQFAVLVQCIGTLVHQVSQLLRLVCYLLTQILLVVYRLLR